MSFVTFNYNWKKTKSLSQTQLVLHNNWSQKLFNYISHTTRVHPVLELCILLIIIIRAITSSEVPWLTISSGTIFLLTFFCGSKGESWKEQNMNNQQMWPSLPLPPNPHEIQFLCFSKQLYSLCYDFIHCIGAHCLQVIVSNKRENLMLNLIHAQPQFTFWKVNENFTILLNVSPFTQYTYTSSARKRRKQWQNTIDRYQIVVCQENEAFWKNLYPWQDNVTRCKKPKKVITFHTTKQSPLFINAIKWQHCTSS